MTTQYHLSRFCDDFLKVKEVPDPWCENGLQIPGKQEIKKVALGTSASKHFLQQAAKWNADAVIVHHGLFWKNGIKKIDTLLATRLRILMKNDISLFGYHLPLDAHITVGNNAQIAKKLHLKNIKMVDICSVGTLEKEMNFVDFEKKCAKIFKQPVNFSADFHGKKVKKIGICSGGGASFAANLLKENIDTFLTGELSENNYHDFKEMNINFVACGHHATERCGVQALGEVLQKQFPDIEFSFFTEECPV